MLLLRAQPGGPSHAQLLQNGSALPPPPSILTFAEEVVAGQKVDKLPCLGTVMKGTANVEPRLLNITGAPAPGAFISYQCNHGL